jgi:hypothetical protein
MIFPIHLLKDTSSLNYPFFVPISENLPSRKQKNAGLGDTLENIQEICKGSAIKSCEVSSSGIEKACHSEKHCAK